MRQAENEPHAASTELEDIVVFQQACLLRFQFFPPDKCTIAGIESLQAVFPFFEEDLRMAAGRDHFLLLKFGKIHLDRPLAPPPAYQDRGFIEDDHVTIRVDQGRFFHGDERPERLRC